MTISRWFPSKKPWVRSGCIGVTICFLLFLFYILVYFPVIDTVYADRLTTDGSTPDWTLILPTITGHFFPLMAHFITESTISVFCRSTQPECVQWMAESGCVDKRLAPTTACAELVELLGFLVITVLLFAVYFALGAGVGWALHRRKRNELFK